MVANSSLNINTRFNSLFAVINNTSTLIGKRLLRERLLNPIINTQELNKRYSYIESFRTDKLYRQYEENLSKIVDLERIHRKISLKMAQPSDFASLDLSYEHIKLILNIRNSVIDELKPSNQHIDRFYDFIQQYTHDFNINEIVKYHLDKITNSFFNEGVCHKIDKVQKNINDTKFIFDYLVQRLGEFIDEKKNNKLLKLEHTDRDGYYITLTSKRSETLKKNLKKKNYLKILIMVSPQEKIIFKTKDLEMKTVTKSNTKLTNSFLKSLSSNLVKSEEEIQVLCKDKFLERLEYYDKNYIEVLDVITKYIANIDLIKSCAKTSCLYGYTKPKLVDHDSSFVSAKDLRHPIIERIQTSINYITNDIELGKDLNGMLLFGTNASGKSSLMKAIGLNIIMAQAGFYVASSDFEFSPYKYLFTRINNNDNIFKGESSFAVEMSELRSILKRCNHYSLILGDELCSGTESISALSIFSSSVITLSECNSHFVFATHLHELCKIPKIMSLEKVKMFHLKVILNEETKELIYDRKLEKGNGPAIYGLEVCRAMDMDRDFLLLAEEIRKNLLNISQNILENKKSHFNSDIFIHNCYVCDKRADDVHHIKFQCAADSNNIIDSSIVKDVKSNLVPLCKTCHNSVHNGNLELMDIQTSEGIKLDYHFKIKRY